MSEYMILSTGQTYYVFSVSFYTALEEKPTILYHGSTKVSVLPLPQHSDLDNSGLEYGSEVNIEEVQNTMAALAVCLENYLNTDIPTGWVI